MTTQTPPTKTVEGIIQDVFEEMKAMYSAPSSRTTGVGYNPNAVRKHIVTMLDAMLTTLQQEIAATHACPKCGRDDQWVLLPHSPCDKEHSVDDTDRA